MVAPTLPRHRELAEFLRTRRERITPEAAGLPRTGRRRTPGLRREEVAALAGVGVTWYTWLEQGRPINVSAQVLGAIAGTLRLGATEREHLFALAGTPDPAVSTGEDQALAPGVRAILSALPYPAYVLSERWDVLDWNSAAAALLVDFDAVPAADRNILLLLFADRGLRERVVDWEASTEQHVATLRSALAAHAGEPAWQRLIARLRDESPEFAEIWERHEVARPSASKIKWFRLPEIGDIGLEATSMWLGERPGARLIAYVPVNDESALGLRRLIAASPPAGA